MARSFWGWGEDGGAFDDAAVSGLAAVVAGRFPGWVPAVTPAPTAAEVQLRPPRIVAPDPLAHLASSDPVDRAGHTYGKAFRDVVRALRRHWPSPPDLVMRPRDAGEVAAVLDWCSDSAVAVVPYGGGSSVVGGVETDCPGFGATVSLDLERLSGVVEVDTLSRAVQVDAGTYGPALEAALRPRGLTLRHFPQSFEFSTVGGWLATRSGGHFATGPTHIDDFVEAVSAVTPAGPVESWRLPASGAGPSPDRLLLGSEGALGIITSAWLRVLDRPRFRASASVSFDSFASGAEACRRILQAGFQPSNCRLLDPNEALTSGVAQGDRAVLLLACESAHHPVDADLDAAVEVARDCGGEARERRDTGGTHADEGQGESERWRGAFLRMPYLRDALARAGAVTETFETAVTWDRFGELCGTVVERVGAALDDVCGGGFLSCRLTHVYPDGAAPYFTVVAPSTLGGQLEAWDEVKAAASEALSSCGATITHHHAVGRVHMGAYRMQRPELFGGVLQAAKASLDPEGILNPGVVV